ncbi:MAG: VOC family protein, partial [Alphaproteobacteria bacterium]
DLAALRQAKLHLEGAGLEVDPRDHAVTKSLYVKDPDGNGVELYVDVSDAWRRDPHLITEVERLEL